MAYLGTKPQSGFISQEANQYFTGLTQNYIDLNQSISSLSSVIVLVNGVVQENSTMSLTSSTRITLGATLVSGDKVTCIYVAKISSTQAPATGSVTSDMLSGSIANSKLANSSITLNGSAVSLGGSATVGGTNTPMFHANFGNTSGTTMSHDTGTKMAFDTEDIDTDNCYSVSNYRFTPNVSGTYFFYGQISMNSSTDYNNKYSICEIKKNGTAITTHNNQNSYYTSTRAIAVTTMNGSSDYVECFGYHTFGTNVDAVPSNLYSYFGGYKLIT